MGKLSRTADIAYNTIKRIYADPYRDVSMHTLDKLARALGVPAEELIETVSDDGGNNE